MVLPDPAKPRLRSIVVAPPEKPLVDGRERAEAPSRPGHCGSSAAPWDASTWKLVQYRRGRWLAARQEDPSPPPPKDQARPALPPVEAFKSGFGNRCFRCLASRHRSSQCRDPQICYSCKRTGHLERQCPARRSKAPASLLPSTTPASPSGHLESTPPPLTAGTLGSLSYAAAVASLGSPPPALEATMPGRSIPGAAHHRPATSTCSVVSTLEMEDEAYRLRTTALLLTAVCPCSGITANMVAEAVEHGQGFPRRDICVAPCFPEDFLLVLSECHQRDLVFERRQLVVAGVKVLLRPCFPPPGGNRVWRFYCRVAIEGLPLNAWSWDNVQEVIGMKCRLDLLERQSTTKTNVSALFAWIWA
ncbi:hypothetical protein D1007_17101 [Hordeum vulgare]|nr:hypothetical protein D1007_17101 [Hordeum vulgare]